MEFGVHPWKPYGGLVIAAYRYQLISAYSFAVLP